MSQTLRRALLWGAVVLVLVALAIPKLVPFGRASENNASPDAAARPVRVTVHEVATQPMVETLATSGTLRADEQVALVAEISGKVEKIHFEEAARVRSGQVLVKIDDVERRAEQERVRYRLELAERRERRQHELVDQGVISQDDYDFALNELNVLRAELRVIEAQLLKTEIRAPFAGILGLRRISPGTYLTPQTTIATLQDVDPIKIDFTVPEAYAGRVRTGQEISFRVRGSETPQRGRIYAVEPGVDPETRSLVLRAESSNPEGTLVPGAFADVEVTLREIPAALSVPAIAVIPELGGKTVFVVEDGKAETRQIETGLRTETSIEVVSGLAAGDLVVISGLLGLKPGQQVEVVQ